MTLWVLFMLTEMSPWRAVPKAIADEQVEDSQQQGGTVTASEITLRGALSLLIG